MILVGGLAAILGPDVLLALAFLLLGGLTWAVWHFISPGVTSLMIHGLKSKKVQRYGKVFFAREPEHKTSNSSILRQSLFPMVFLLGASLMLLPILQHLGYTPHTLSSDDLAIFVLEVSFLIWPIVSVLVVPVMWTMHALGLRRLNEETQTIERFEINPHLHDFVGFAALFTFMFHLFAGGEDMGASLISLVLLLWFLYPPALLSTAVFHRFSLTRAVERVHRGFQSRGLSLEEFEISLIKP